ncbi:hypothetical protein EG68_12578 [Paragonimus skrjabini miyazakii]|uniref:UDP-N-acetylglucosamine transferase subunit ALG13 n=1 Tax=Paragonimus skrjabini miyazakii TaxID=59628 RepID=A0A8S9YC66_9TREM|nr:hypothetical protein EG68_12578 [Paragonimus skrjabini miyazakii]
MERDRKSYPCEEHKVELLFCLLRSDCCQIKRLTPRKCLEPENLPEECKAVFRTFNLCRIELVGSSLRQITLRLINELGSVDVNTLLTFDIIRTTSFDKLIEVTNNPSFYAALSWLGYTDLVVQFGGGVIVPSPPSQASIDDVAASSHLVGSSANGCQTESLHMLRLRAFRYKDSLDGEISSSSLVISHGGAATCLQALTPFGSRRLVVVINDSLSGNHQEELALTLARGGHAVVTSPERLLSLLWNGMGHDQSLYFNKVS